MKRIILKPELVDRLGVSYPTVWRMIKRGEFPEPRQISPGRVGWLEKEIEEWLETRPHSREAMA